MNISPNEESFRAISGKALSRIVKLLFKLKRRSIVRLALAQVELVVLKNSSLPQPASSQESTEEWLEQPMAIEPRMLSYFLMIQGSCDPEPAWRGCAEDPPRGIPSDGQACLRSLSGLRIEITNG
jgi:hypothetical protein